eukprot:TRINITY_DN7208_c0_g1_i5.p1 TRINITY_DN7208_c0_g1~~TRINITY_DN7208_c0_g1_i5.p1  ORF type:complete len:231 (-),score=65.21 TRINITY_DN7208_c0_g1_i5:124-816(-)
MGDQPIVKVVLIGDTGVGKSCIANRFTHDKFNSDNCPGTGAMFVSKALDYPEYDMTVRFQIWDTAGQERYRGLALMHYRDADAALLVYDISNRGSFEDLSEWLKELNDKAPKEILMYIVANKADLVENEAVTLEEGRKFAEEHNATFKMTSAKDNTGIKDVFSSIPVSLGLFVKERMEEQSKARAVRRESRREPEKVRLTTKDALKPSNSKGCCCCLSLIISTSQIRFAI